MIRTDSLTPNGENCIEFYYYRDSGSIGELNIYSLKNSELNNKDIGYPIWSEPPNFDYGLSWKIVQTSLPLGFSTENFYILFEEYVRGGESGTFKYNYNQYLIENFLISLIIYRISI